MQQLPAGMQAQAAQQPAGVCHVCFVEDYTDDNLLLEVCLHLCSTQACTQSWQSTAASLSKQRSSLYAS